MEELLSRRFLQNQISDYIISIALFLFLVGVLYVINKFIAKYLKKISEKTAAAIDDFFVSVVSKIIIPLSFYGVFYLSVSNLVMPAVIRRGIDILGTAAIIFFLAHFLTMFVTYGIKIYLSKRSENGVLRKSLGEVSKTISVLIWGVSVIFFLDNVGFQVSAVIAGLGIGGIAVALAAQALLKDLFSYFAIMLDRPFELGDFIVIDDYLGTVEHIGIKTTRIRSLGGEQVIFSNTDLTDSRLRNYKRMEKRRVVFTFGVTYETSARQLREIPVIVKGIINNIKDTVFERAHFFSFGDSSLIFEIVYYVVGSDYNKYMDIQQEVNLNIKEELGEKGIEFAYPTQTIFLAKPTK